MPRERHKRGRRGDAKKENEHHKRKREPDGPETETPKRQKVQNENEQPPVQQENVFVNGEDYVPLEGGDLPIDDTPFYGLLDSDEQEYFSRANQTLEFNQFEGEEDRRIFVDSVLEEANGKELKIACSQSCSRLMEKLISLSSANQLKHLFAKFHGHFLHLVQHRFASHCCERLFQRAAPIVTYEMKPREKKGADVSDNENEETVSDQSMADLVLSAISELDGNWGYLLTESFASHTIRVLLLILAGEPLDTSNVAVIASRKKENLSSLKTHTHFEHPLAEKRDVPSVFREALEKMIKDLITGLDTTYLRALATHPIGSPVLQVLLMVELTHLGKGRSSDPNSVIRRLLPDDCLQDTDSATFLNGLFYDPIGSRLLETLLRYLPGKSFKGIYRNIIQDRIGSLSRNEIASYVVVRVLERLSKEDLQTAMGTILREIPSMVERSRLNVIRTLIERGTVRGADLTPLAEALKSAYGDDPISRLSKILRLDDNAQANDGPPNDTSSLASQQLHGSLLAQAMLQVPGPLSGMIRSSLLELPPSTLLGIAKSPTASRVLQESLKFPKSNSQFRRQIIPRFTGHLCELAMDSSGSHVVDTLWQATADLLFLKQRAADELINNEKVLRDSFLGRAVWRNWSLDLYKRKRGEWMAKAKGQTDSKSSHPEHVKQKSKLDLARERFAAKSEEKVKKESKIIQTKGRREGREIGADRDAGEESIQRIVAAHF
ncbi:Nucleolar protein 9 [Ophidiomyces ophidiicola]|nr:Nucleolar protein 9 [Ophidiomyces ophidiicola]KAI1978101.1 Nucleolar protein 9 [Ophidiomyces ophidiicola]KAI1985929.1 Nucleolar protein 9 [Ophidiomyces ophidiicola]KAI1987009.1 Nucleolar protein 9 [Ophidiomyces ophidiicola]KAI1992831.1 Nucleolar protein 9 [Ophidiomyces ophidiicola]